MYCPRCAAENIEDASFCRSCGADIRLVPQALSGTLPSVTAGEGEVESAAGRRRRKKKEDDGPPSKAKGIENIFLGVGFLFVSLAIWAFMPGGFVWWFWMLIPAFALLGGGVSQIIQAREQRHQFYLRGPSVPPSFAAPSLQPPAPPRRFSSSAASDRELTESRHTDEITTPPSVTEATTRHLQSAAEKTKPNV